MGVHETDRAGVARRRPVSRYKRARLPFSDVSSILLGPRTAHEHIAFPKREQVRESDDRAISLHHLSTREMKESGVSPVTWDSLENYISTYAGRTKIVRLLHIAERFEALRVLAYSLALSILEAESLDTMTYETIVQKLATADPGRQVHGGWVTEASKKAVAITDKLEQELKAYKNNLIKESIRMGQQDIANHYVKTGDLTSALRALVRNRDYCTTPLHIFQTNMAIVNVSIQLGQWAQVQSYIARIDNMPTQIKEKTAAGNALYIASALALLNQGRYREAAEKFLTVEATIGNDYNTVMTMNDIANFTCLMALATFSRAEVLALIESASFKPFLELEVSSREALATFHKSRYADCFRLLDGIRGNMEADIHFHSHVDRIYTLIRERSMIQFTGAFNVVSLDRMSTVFSLSVSEVQEALATLIADAKLLETRIDLRQRVVVHESKALRETVYQKTFETSDHYAEEVERSLFHLAVAKAGLQVESATVKSGPRRDRHDPDLRKSQFSSVAPADDDDDDENDDSEMMVLS